MRSSRPRNTRDLIQHTAFMFIRLPGQSVLRHGIPAGGLKPVAVCQYRTVLVAGHVLHLRN